MKKITNKNYRKLLDEGIITPITEQHISQALHNIKGKHAAEGRALLITLYYTGARPTEILQLKPQHFSKDKSYLKIQVPASKGGLPRPIYLQLKNSMVQELHKYTQTTYPTMHLFKHYIGKHTRTIQTKTGIKTATETTYKLRYHINKWFEGVIEGSIPPYYLRHNRFSKLAEAGLDLQDLRMMKGSKTYESIIPYLHMSTKTAKNIAKKIK